MLITIKDNKVRTRSLYERGKHMCKKYIKLFVISAFIVFCMPIIACAAPAEDKIEVVEDNYFDYFMDYFKLEEIEFIDMEQDVDDSMKSLLKNRDIEISDSVIDEEDDNEKPAETAAEIEQESEELELKEAERDINEFSFLYLNKGFEEKISIEDNVTTDSVINVVPTFSATKNISGTGEEGIVVGVMVWDEWTADRRPNNITFKSEIQTIGPSKLFNDTIEFNTIGTNYILIAVMKDGMPDYKIYVLNRKEEETKKKLENLEIEFIKLDESTEEDEEQNIENETDNLFEISDDPINEIHETIESK